MVLPSRVYVAPVLGQNDDVHSQAAILISNFNDGETVDVALLVVQILRLRLRKRALKGQMANGTICIALADRYR